MPWIIPSIRQEIGEFERIAETFKIELSTLLSLFRTGVVEELDATAWEALGNTDSWDTVSFEQVLEAAAYIGRDAQSLLHAFRAERPMQMPIILYFANGQSHLVSGNTRLMVCRAIKKRPLVLKLYYDPFA